MVVNAAQLATYSQAKQAILSSGYIQVFETLVIRGIVLLEETGLTQGLFNTLLGHRYYFI